jgi:hypothetical protein
MKLPAVHSTASIALAAAFFAVCAIVLSIYGWIVNGSAIFLAMSNGLAPWCM